jgi:hypothetical protein
MQSSEIQQLANLINQQSAGFHPLYVLLSVVVAGLAAFLGAYLKVKGEDRARNEQFQSLVEQLKITTRETEEIKQLINGKAWRHQQQWTAREKYYSELLNILYRIEITLDDLAEYFSDRGTEHLRDEEHGPRFTELMRKSGEFMSDLRDLIGSSELYLSPPTVNILKKMQSDHWTLVNFDAACSADYIFGAQKLVKMTRTESLKEAKLALGLADA